MRRSSRCAETSPSAITSRRGLFPWPGSCSHCPLTKGATGWTQNGSGSPFTSTTMRPPTSGTRLSGCRVSASSAAGRPTTSGRWVCRDRVVRAARSTTTADPNTGSKVVRSLMKTATSRCGTWSSCNSPVATVVAKRTSRSWVSCRRRTSTPGWVWSGWQHCYRVSTTSTRSTRAGQCWTKPARSPVGPMVPTNRLMWPCA